MKWLFLFILVMIVGGLSSLSGKVENLQKDFASQLSLQSSLEIKSRECMKKAARYANEVDPRHYTEGTVERIYAGCLKDYGAKDLRD